MGVCVLTANPSSNLSAAVPFFPRRYFFLGILSPEIEFPVAVMPIRNSRRSDKGLATRHRCDAQLLLTLLQERVGRGYLVTRPLKRGVPRDTFTAWTSRPLRPWTRQPSLRHPPSRFRW